MLKEMPLIRTNIASGYPFEDIYGYARAVRVGDQVFASGTTARPPHLGGDA
jgi:enamine deaminase RidA (YjgF/YER057c/UK114 family)